MNIVDVILAFSISTLLSYLTTPFVIRLARKWKLVDDPKKRFHPAQTHTTIVPRAGGLAISIAIITTIIIFLPWSPVSMALILATLLLTIVGIYDDRKDVHPRIRLLTNGLAVVAVLIAGISIPYITNPLPGPDILRLDFWTIAINNTTVIAPIAIIAAFLWLYWTMNVVGWSAGVDGQLPGVVVIAAVVLGILSLRFASSDPTQLYVTILSAIVAGSFLGFLPWNFFPQKIMPGYSGKTLAGFFLGLLGILSYAKIGTALLVLGIPMIDAVFTLSRRLLAGKSPIWADRGHLHHHLLNLGFSKKSIALFYYLLSAILGLIALTVSSSQKILFFIVVGVVVGGFLIWANWQFISSKRQDRDNG